MNRPPSGTAREALTLGPMPGLTLSLSLSLALLLGACATRQPAESVQTTASPTDCQALLTQIQASEADKRLASENKANAWKAVVPFLVAARYASSQSQLGEADERIGKLGAEFERQGCSRLSS